MSLEKKLTNARCYVTLPKQDTGHFKTLLSRMTLIEGGVRKCGAFIGISCETIARAHAGTITPRTARKIIDAYERVGE